MNRFTSSCFENIGDILPEKGVLRYTGNVGNPLIVRGILGYSGIVFEEREREREK
jgi:hypothetical protein